MNKALVYVVGFIGAVGAALILYVLVRDGLGVSRHSIVVDALAFAGVLCMACAAGALMKARK